MATTSDRSSKRSDVISLCVGQWFGCDWWSELYSRLYLNTNERARKVSFMIIPALILQPCIAVLDDELTDADSFHARSLSRYNACPAFFAASLQEASSAAFRSGEISEVPLISHRCASQRTRVHRIWASASVGFHVWVQFGGTSFRCRSSIISLWKHVTCCSR